jgi:alpha-tubulin suppressor-like RCC1 family protein
VAVSGNHSFVQLSAGRTATCGRVAEGRAYCWGDARNAQLGDGDLKRANEAINKYRTTPVGVGGVP